MIYKIKVLTPSFHLHQWGPLKAFGRPRNAYFAADQDTQSVSCWLATACNALARLRRYPFFRAPHVATFVRTPRRHLRFG